MGECQKDTELMPAERERHLNGPQEDQSMNP